MTQENPNADTIRINGNTVKLAIAVLAFAGGLAGGVWATAQWKISVDDHLQRIEEHLQDEDKHLQQEHQQLQWLINHSKDATDAPTEWKAPVSQSNQPIAVSDPPESADSFHLRQ